MVESLIRLGEVPTAYWRDMCEMYVDEAFFELLAKKIKKKLSEKLQKIL